MNKYKFNIFRRKILTYLIGTTAMLIIILICIIISSNSSTEQIYLEGALKSTPLLSNETLKRLGNKYIELNREFERQIKNLETGYANRKNKRGDWIYYGVNGKENCIEMLNDDYVNGIASITYLKGGVDDRKDGESNFADMITVLNTTLESEIDKYDDEIDNLFEKLFWLSHTFTGTSTELYPCKHGCTFVKYYCGDNLLQGKVNNETVGYGNCDLKYDPFLVSYKNYQVLEDMVDSFGTDDIDLFNMAEAEGTCEVDANGAEIWNYPSKQSTKSFRGCQESMVDCYHGGPVTYSNGNLQCPHASRDILKCIEPQQTTTNECAHICPENCGGENGCQHDCSGGDDDSEEEHHMCGFYYECQGHTHYFCKGHILCCCFGHTNLNLSIKIMYYEEMLDKFKELLVN